MGTESAGAVGRMLIAGSVDLFDLLPSPVLPVELGSARVPFANVAARALGAGAYPPRLAERVAAGERIAGEQLDGTPPRGCARSWSTAARWPCRRRARRDGHDRRRHRDRGRPAARRAARRGERGARPVARPAPDAAHRRPAHRPRFADWCFVELVEPDGTIRRALVEHADPIGHALASEYDRPSRIAAEDFAAPAGVIWTGEPELLRDIPDELLHTVAGYAERLGCCGRSASDGPSTCRCAPAAR